MRRSLAAFRVAVVATGTATADRVDLVSDEAPGQPRFRLRYDRRGPDELAINFAIAMPGAPDFQHDTGGVVHRVHPGRAAP